MHKRVISATELKNKTAEIINEVSYGKHIAVIERHGKPVVEIVPVRRQKSSMEEIKKALDDTFGSIPDFPDVTKSRTFRKRNIRF